MEFAPGRNPNSSDEFGLQSSIEYKIVSLVSRNEGVGKLPLLAAGRG
jgi:hypothetical protein